jgi:hypothetical protein
MNVHPPNGELGDLLEELRTVTDDARKVFGGLSAMQLNWKPALEQWSVGQCFEHLIKTNRGFYTPLEEVARGEQKSTLWQRASPLSGLFGWLVMRSLGSSRKFPAPRALQPSTSDVDAAIIGSFVEHQDDLTARMRAVEGADLKGTVITSPIAGFVTYSMFDACRIVVAHERRHFAQAQRVTQAEGFPRA